MENKIPSYPSKWRINGASLQIFYGLTLFQLAEGGNKWLLKHRGFNEMVQREQPLRNSEVDVRHVFRCTQRVLLVSARVA